GPAPYLRDAAANSDQLATRPHSFIMRLFLQYILRVLQFRLRHSNSLRRPVPGLTFVHSSIEYCLCGAPSGTTERPDARAWIQTSRNPEPPKIGRKAYVRSNARSTGRVAKGSTRCSQFARTYGVQRRRKVRHSEPGCRQS